MSDAIKALEALRDAAQLEKDFQETQHADASNTLWLSACQTISSCNRAIAALRPEEPKACAGFACEGYRFKSDLATVRRGYHEHHHETELCCECRCRCGQPYSAHQPSESVKVSHICAVHDSRGDGRCPYCCPSEQPAHKVEVPPMPDLQSITLHGHGDFDGEWIRLSDVRALHAAAVALAERCERAENTLPAQSIMQLLQDCDRLADERDEARAQLAEAQALAEQYRTSASAARAEERERCAKAITAIAVRVDTATQHLDAESRGGIKATARVSALYEARDAIRALPEEVE